MFRWYWIVLREGAFFYIRGRIQTCVCAGVRARARGERMMKSDITIDELIEIVNSPMSDEYRYRVTGVKIWDACLCAYQLGYAVRESEEIIVCPRCKNDGGPCLLCKGPPYRR